LGAAIRSAHPDAEVDLVPGGRGDFIVTADGQRLWDKRRMDDQFPEHRVILDKLGD
jgi:predicted Rdx family selenoprotein